MRNNATNGSFWDHYRQKLEGRRDRTALSISRRMRRGLDRSTPKLAEASVSGAPSTSSSNMPSSVPEWDTTFSLPDIDRIKPTLGTDDARYELTGQTLGKGGMGTVFLARDNVLQRQVALKVPHPDLSSDPSLQRRLLTEPLLTARLEHPNIVPVYDLVVTRDRHYGYTMRRVEGERLSEILKGLRRAEPDRMSQYGRVRLLTIFSQVVVAVAYAHDQRIVHRDLKPNNVMIGRYGEVLLLDWGLARSLDHRLTQTQKRDKNSTWDFEGAPAYVAPEQRDGDTERVDSRSDIYSLGAILYEILTYNPPYQKKQFEDDEAFVSRIRSEPVPPPSSGNFKKHVSKELERICMKCLEQSPEDRYRDALDIHRDIAAFLEGTREQRWRRKSAKAKTDEANAALERYRAQCLRVEQIQAEVENTAARIKPHEPVSRKRELWKLEDLVRRAEEEAIQDFSAAENAYLQALDHLSDFGAATQGLAQLYWERFLQAESSADWKEMQYCRNKIRTYDVDREFVVRLRGDANLNVETDPPGAEVVLYAYREKDRILTPVEMSHLGTSPIRNVRLPVGRYLLVLRHPRAQETRFPLAVGRLETIEARVRLYPDSELGEDFIYIPAGTARLGGDPGAYRPKTETPWIEDFAIGRYPITATEYLEFLNALLLADPDEAYRRAPRRDTDNAHIWKTGPDGLFQIVNDIDGDAWLPGFPIFLIGWDDAVAYATWRGLRDDREYRLPTCNEWEKAARGVDGRVFPWGDQFDATFCKNRNSKPSRPLPEPVGSYRFDVSAYGVCDMAGGVSDWTLDHYEAEPGFRLTKGGNWTAPERSCRAARNLYYRQDGTNNAVGFRLAFSLSRKWSGR